MKLVYLFLTAFLLAACDDFCAGEWDYHVVVDVVSCTDTIGGYGGSTGKCRVVLKDGRRATVDAPVAVGDKYASKGSCIWLEGSRYAPIYAGILSP